MHTMRYHAHNYVPSHGKSEIMHMAKPNRINPLKSEIFFFSTCQAEVREICSIKEIDPEKQTSPLLSWKRPHKSGHYKLTVTPANCQREWGSQSCSCKELSSANNLNEREDRFSQEPLGRASLVAQ